VIGVQIEDVGLFDAERACERRDSPGTDLRDQRVVEPGEVPVRAERRDPAAPVTSRRTAQPTRSA
jgi:hypothetical protein